MPRMRVDLRPSTVQFDDGEDPVIGGLARFGTAMANLPVQIGRIKMEQAQVDERNNEFQAEHQLRMHADARAQEEHGLHMRMGRGEDIEKGYETPDIPDGAAVSPDQIREQELAKGGRDRRAAEIEALKNRGLGHGESKPYSHFTTKDGYDYILNETTGKYEKVGEDVAPAAPAAKPAATGHWWDSIANAWSAKGQPSAFNSQGHVPLRMGTDPGAVDHSQANPPSDLPGGVDPYEEAKRQYDQGNHMPMKDLLRRDPKARARAQAEVDAKKPSRFQPPTMSGLGGWMSGAGGASD